jgi:hypothetical protein
MANLKGVVGQSSAIKGALKPQSTMRAKTLAMAPRQSLLDLTDVDASRLADGATLIYETSTQTFSVRNEMDNANTKIIGGFY